VLLDHLPALRDRLAEQNIRVERFDVDVRQEQQSGGSDPRASQQQERQQQPPQSQPRHSTVRASGPEEITHDVVAVRQHATNTSINVLA
jgi:flagellar hook-length control protein FliK